MKLGYEKYVKGITVKDHFLARHYGEFSNKSMNNKIICAISGICNAGKDTLALILKDKFEKLDYTCKIVSLASNLKTELQPLILEKYGFDILNCSRAEKDSVRELIINHARLKRIETWGQHWWRKLEGDLEKCDQEIIIISDCRFAKYKLDEHYFIQKLNNGVIIHLTRYDLDKDNNRIYVEPPNDEERENDPLIKTASDIKFEWQSGKTQTIEVDDLFIDILKYLNTLENIIL